MNLTISLLLGQGTPPFAPPSSTSSAGATLDLLQRSQAIAKDSYETWNTIWDGFFDSELWTGMVIVGLLIAGLSLISAAIQWLPELTSQTFDGRRTFRLFAPIIAVVMVLGNNGRILSGVLQTIRGIGVDFVNLPLKLQIMGTTLDVVLRRLALGNAVIAGALSTLKPCQNKTGPEFQGCMEKWWALINTADFATQVVGDAIDSEGEPVTLERAFRFLESIAPSPFATGETPSDLGSFSEAAHILNPTGLLFNEGSPNIDQFLAATQAAFVNGLEIALLGAFALSPIVLALLLTSRGGQALFGWLSGIGGLYATQLIYNALIGLIALFVLTKDDVAAATGDPSTLMSGLDQKTFAVFVSFLAPLISLGLGYGQFNRALSSAFATGRFESRQGNLNPTNVPPNLRP